MPRVVTGAVGVLLLVLLSPVVVSLDGKRLLVQVTIVVFTVPIALVGLAFVASAIRPGTIRRLFRR